ncbi:MAG: chorismate mutase [Desulfovibrio sp.]|jgi:chorismate mutase/prephenate dehydratase|nr:chorismate mutase [Desulfovibrio sp.]
MSDGLEDAGSSAGCGKTLVERLEETDRQLLELLQRRAGLSLSPGEAENLPESAGRVAELWNSVPGPLPEEHFRSIYREILSSARSLRAPRRAAFSDTHEGLYGDFAHIAARDLLGASAAYRPEENPTAVFRAVASGEADIGIVPAENSMEGAAPRITELFLTHDLSIKAELYCRLGYCLLSGEQALSSVHSLFAHPRSLARCWTSLQKRLPGIRIVPVENHTEAVNWAEGTERAGALTPHAPPHDTAVLFPLPLLEQGFENESGGRARFFVIGASGPARPGADKSTLLFTTGNKAEDLSRVLHCFAGLDADIAVTASRALPEDPAQRAYLVDIAADLAQPRCAGVADRAAARCRTFKILGSYTAGNACFNPHPAPFAG